MANHDWQPTAPSEDGGDKRLPGISTIWPWRCASCGAYAESAVARNTFVEAGHKPPPSAPELERWGVAADCNPGT